MSPLQLAGQLTLAAVVLVAANLGIRMLAENSIPRQLLRNGEHAVPATDVFLGNSTMAAGLDGEAFAAARPGRRPLNMALGDTTPVEHYLIYHRQGRHAGAAVYYGFMDTQLTDSPRGGWSTLVGNRALAYYVDPEVAVGFYAPDSLRGATAIRLVSRVPALVERGAIWAKVERVRRALGEAGMPKQETNRFGRAEDFAQLEPDPEDFARRCERAAAVQIPLSGPVAALVRDARERGGTVYVVEMPMPEGHRRRFYGRPEWRAYRDQLIELVRQAGGRYVPAADWIGEDGFADALHLNADGSRSFSRRLAQFAPGAR